MVKADLIIDPVEPETRVVVRAPALTAQFVWGLLGGLLALELVLAFAFGATVGLAVSPMEGSGKAVAVRTVLHLLVSSGLFWGLCAVCGLPPTEPPQFIRTAQKRASGRKY